MDRRTHAADTELEFPSVATGESAQMPKFATGVGSKADIGAPPMTQLWFMSTRPSLPVCAVSPRPTRLTGPGTAATQRQPPCGSPVRRPV